MWTTQGRCPQIHRASNSSQLSDLMMTSKQAGPPLPVTSQQLTLPPPPTSSSRRCAIFAQIQAAIDNTHFKAKPFLYQVNEWVRKEAASQQRYAHQIPFGPNAQILPNKPHGLNTYLNTHNIAFLSSL